VNPIVMPGDRIRLVEMPDDPNPILSGETGTVRSIEKCANDFIISVDWDSGRTLNLITPPDKFTLV